MHLLNFRCAQRFNDRHERRGHLFQERFHTRVIRDDEHLGNACDYVLDNAVRGGLCVSRDEWPWLGGEFAVDLR
jgi:putative transposase